MKVGDGHAAEAMNDGMMMAYGVLLRRGGPGPERIHVLAYLGGKQWIQAEPGIMRVITLTAPNDNDWLKQPVHIVRWNQMKEFAHRTNGE